MDSEEIAARDSLELNRTDKFWCTYCCRPRIKNYCPASSHSKQRHAVIKRSTLTFEQQLEYYMFRGHGAFRGER